MADSRASRVLGRVVDYIFGRNTLIGLASLMLLTLSGYATWHGMRDFIIGVSASPLRQDQPLPGGITFSNDALVIAVVVALTFLLWLMLRETFGAKRGLRVRVVTFPLYLFLAIWSIGFGYGFWWSLISGEEATRTGLLGLEEDARDASATVAARLDAVRGQLDSVVGWSDSQMSREETSGGSCGTASGAGRGPLYNARRSVRDSVSALRERMVKSWLEPVAADVEQLRQAAAVLGGASLEERQRNFEARASEIRGRARNIAARSNELGTSMAAEMRALARVVAVPPGGSGFSCYDPTLAERLEQAAAQAEQPAKLTLRAAVFNEGPAGVANAVKNLWSNVGAYASSLAAYIASGGKLAFGRTVGGEPITGRDLIALLATIGIDLGLLALAILNPPREGPSLRPSGALRRQINAAINTAIARAGVDREWVQRHFIHHRRASYFVIPNLHACDPNDPQEAARGLAMNQLAGVLSDLELVRWPNPGSRWLMRKSELQRLKEEEDLASDTDLSEVRKRWNEAQGPAPDRTEAHGERPIRNHGLFSKAERALQIAGWSARARGDIEIFRLVDAEGLTPLLMVLNDAGADSQGGETAPTAARAAAATGA
jgi:hypothetical protein